MSHPKNWKCDCGFVSPYTPGQRCPSCKTWRWPVRGDVAYWWNLMTLSGGPTAQHARMMIEQVLIDLHLLPKPMERPGERAMRLSSVASEARNATMHTICVHCDHFVVPNPEIVRDQTAVPYLHVDDGSQIYNHHAEPGMTRSYWDWVNKRPELFDFFIDKKCGPNSECFPGRRGKVDEKKHEKLKADVGD